MGMARAILADDELECDHYERGDHGVTLYDTFGDEVAFVPYHNLHAVVA